LANFVVSNKVDDEEFESEEKTGNGNSFVRHFDEKPPKTAEIAGNRPAFLEFEPPRTKGPSAMPPAARRSDSEYAECN